MKWKLLIHHQEFDLYTKKKKNSPVPLLIKKCPSGIVTWNLIILPACPQFLNSLCLVVRVSFFMENA